jgi:hypothetical protein
MIAHSAVAAVSDRRRRSEIDATIYVALYSGNRRNVAAHGERRVASAPDFQARPMASG